MSWVISFYSLRRPECGTEYIAIGADPTQKWLYLISLKPHLLLGNPGPGEGEGQTDCLVTQN